jgi:site-specific recombinase XerD
MKLSTCLIEFFSQYLPRIKGVSKRTLENYRTTFTLFIPFVSQYFSIKIQSLRIDHLTPEVILAFLNYLENQRKNIARTRNLRLAAIKSFSKMIRLLYPEQRDLIEKILKIPEKKIQQKLIGFMYPDEILKVFKSVDLKKKYGFRDYTILHLLYDSGARASEIANLNIDHFDFQHKTLAILGKGNRYRLINICTKTVQLIRTYIIKYRIIAKPLYRHNLFINQRGEKFTRHGIYWICRKHLTLILPEERLKILNPVCSFRHSCAVDMLCSGKSPDEIKYRLGHRNINSTMEYLHLDLNRTRELQKEIIEYTQSILPQDPQIEKFIDWENKEKVLSWLDSL